MLLRVRRFRPSPREHSRGNSNGGLAGWYVIEHDGICADPCIATDTNASQDLCPCSDVNVPFENRCAGLWPTEAKGNLLEQEAIGADVGTGVDNDAVWMREEQSTSNLAVERYVGTCDRGPERMGNDPPESEEEAKRAAAILPSLVLPDRSKQTPRRVPESLGVLSAPVRRMSRRNGHYWVLTAAEWPREGWTPSGQAQVQLTAHG